MHPYDNRVYLLSSYILETVKNLKEKSESDFMNFNFSFNPFVIPFDYKEQIVKVNKELSKNEIEIEMAKSDRAKQFHRYDLADYNLMTNYIDNV